MSKATLQKISEAISNLEFDLDTEIAYMEVKKIPPTNDYMHDGWECALRRVCDIIAEETK